MVLIALLVVIFGAVRYFRVQAAMQKGMFPASRMCVLGLVYVKLVLTWQIGRLLITCDILDTHRRFCLSSYLQFCRYDTVACGRLKSSNSTSEQRTAKPSTEISIYCHAVWPIIGNSTGVLLIGDLSRGWCVSGLPIQRLQKSLSRQMVLAGLLENSHGSKLIVLTRSFCAFVTLNEKPVYGEGGKTGFTLQTRYLQTGLIISRGKGSSNINSDSESKAVWVVSVTSSKYDHGKQLGLRLWPQIALYLLFQIGL